VFHLLLHLKARQASACLAFFYFIYDLIALATFFFIFLLKLNLVLIKK
jgi:hypothetical protein